ncbi:MAG: 7-cyano-7-deazaguanine synthase QueC [Deltaproteobacteria bacterium]|nr:7-cyano-7-deazaguanine synthase QueC [Deltaproteobacteria bacterium]
MSIIKKAVVLSSGGIDSTTAMAIAKQEGFSIYSLSFNYGQRHSFELESARRVAAFFKVEEHMILDIDLRKIGGSSLTAEIDVPKKRPAQEMTQGIPVTYVPARNTIFLSYALGWAEVLECGDIFIGVTAVDYSGYPDCRPEYIEAFEKMANLATKAGVENRTRLKIHTPLIQMTKSEIIRCGSELGVDYSMTHSCYDPSPEGYACGSCDSCLFRKKGFTEAGIPDPTEYK